MSDAQSSRALGPTMPLYRGLTDDLRLAHLLADDADSITMSRFKALDLHVTTKPDLTPVTDADTAVEEALRRTLGRARPRDAVHGEEMERHRLGSAALGDRPDRRHQELRPRRAGLGHPDRADDQRRGRRSAWSARRRSGRRWWASRGGGAYAGKSLMSASPMPRLRRGRDRGRVPELLLDLGAGSRPGQGQQFVDLLRTCWRTRAYGDFWSYMLLAEGGVDIACEPELALHDMAACSVIVTEAGGRFTDLDGRPGPLGRRRRTPPTAGCTTRCWRSWLSTDDGRRRGRSTGGP